MNTLNTTLYTHAAESLRGGKRRKNRSHGSKHRRRGHTQSQRGGLFPGLGGIIQQALVPFGLYALQHSMKKRGNKNGTASSFRKFNKFTRRR
jgi:hypothetical protein